MRKLELKDIILYALIAILLVIVLANRLFPKTTNKGLEKEIKELRIAVQQGMDSIQAKETIIKQQEIDITGIENKIKRLSNQLTKIDEKLKKDTTNVAHYNGDQLDSFFRARYPRHY